MTPEQLESIKRTIAESIEKNVNGKVKLLTQKFDDYVISDMAWKDKADPVIQMGENLQGGGRVLIWFAGFVSAVGGAYLIIKNILK